MPTHFFEGTRVTLKTNADFTGRIVSPAVPVESVLCHVVKDVFGRYKVIPLDKLEELKAVKAP